MLRNYRLQNYNFKLVFNVLVLMAMSLLFIHSAKASYVPKQALGIIMGLGIIVVVSLIDYQVFTRNAATTMIMITLLSSDGWKVPNGPNENHRLAPLTSFPNNLTPINMITFKIYNISAFLVKT